MRLASGHGRGLSSTWSTIANSATLAPMQTASVAALASVKVLSFERNRSPARRSRSIQDRYTDDRLSRMQKKKLKKKPKAKKKKTTRKKKTSRKQKPAARAAARLRKPARGRSTLLDPLGTGTVGRRHRAAR